MDLLLSTTVSHIPANLQDGEYLEKVKPLIQHLLVLFSVRTDANWLRELIDKRYSCCDPSSNTEHNSTDDLDVYRDELRQLYQTLDASLTPIDKLKNVVQGIVFESNIQDQFDFNAFGEYTKTLLHHALPRIDHWNVVISSAISTMRNKDQHTEMHNQIDGLMSSAKDLLESAQGAVTKAQEAVGRAQAAQRAAEAAQCSAEAAKCSAETAQTSAEQSRETAEGSASQAKSQVDNVLTNVLTILGVFVAIIVAFVGGFFSIMASLKADISPIAQVHLAHFLLMGHVLFNLLFLFMFMIARLSDKSICISCLECTNKEKRGVCGFCDNHCAWYQRAFHKYPYYVVANWIFVLGYVALYIWWYADVFCYDVFCSTIEWLSPSVGLLVITVVAGLLFVGLPVWMYRKIRSSPHTT